MQDIDPSQRPGKTQKFIINILDASNEIKQNCKKSFIWIITLYLESLCAPYDFAS